MKYIKLYEAFQSTILSKINKYLKTTGVSDKHKKEFLGDLNTIFGSYEIPIDKIQDSDIIYKSRTELYPIKSTEFDNEFGIWGIKFWFSKDGEYLGKTAIGNYKQSEVSSNENNPLPVELLLRIRNGYLGDKYKTGNLTPINKDLDSYSQLTTGLEVIAYLHEDPWYSEYNDDVNTWEDPLTAGTIYISGEKIFIIHNNEECDGSYPHGHDVGEYGSYSWGLSNSVRVFNDHYYLSIYEPSDKPLDFISNNGLEVDSNNPDIFNLDLSNDGSISSFKTKRFNKIKNDADFGILINLDSILKRGGYEKISDTKLKRQDSKSGIIGGSLGLSNDELKEINIKRYSDLIITRYGISTEGVNFDRLNVFLANLMSEYFIFDLIGSRNLVLTRFQNLLRYIQDLILSIKNNNKSEVERYFSMIISTINMIKLSKKEFANFDNRIYGILEENEKFGNLLLTIKEVGKYNVDKLKSTSLDNLYSLEMLSKKYSTINNHIRDSYDSDMQRMSILVTTFVHGTDYTEDWDGLSSIDFDKCRDIVKSLKVFI